MIICKSCDENLPQNAFYLKDKTSKRYDTTCKECRKSGARQWHQINKEKSLENKRNWHKENREKMTNRMKNRYHSNIVEERKQRKDWRKQNSDRVKSWNQKSYKKNRESILAQKKVYSKENKDKINKYRRNRYQTNFGVRMETANRLRMRDALKGKMKDELSKKYLGCTTDFLQTWIRFQFYDGMDVNNHGEYWHLDHVKPCESFNLADEKQLKECFHWSNLQPLKAEKNMAKSDTIIPRMILMQQLKAHIFETKVWPEMEALLKQPNYFMHQGQVLYDDLPTL